jgi:flagellar basal body-associated protein FliL
MRVFRIVSVTLLVLVVGFLLAWYGGNFQWSMPWDSQSSQSKQPTGKTGPGEVGPVVRLEPFLFTEWEDNGERMNTVTFELEVSDDQGRDALKSRTSEVRSEILKLLADVQLSTIEDANGYEALKTLVQKRVQALMPSHPIRRVLITELLSQ